MRQIAPVMTVVAGLVIVGCADDSVTSTRSTAPTVQSSSDPPPNCLVRLHGKGGDGEPDRVVGGVIEVSPAGNADGWGARQWVYDSDERYAEAKGLVVDALDDAGCTRAVVNGFSNGGAFAAALYCNGERFDGRVVGYVIDDPVPDEAVLSCDPDPGTEVALYWTGALDEAATPGASCADLDWTCDGGSLLGIERYATELGTAASPSPYVEHCWYRDAPETTLWLSD